MPTTQTTVLEKDLLRAINKQVKRWNVEHPRDQVWVRKLSGGKYQMKSLPDTVWCYRGRFGALELKRSGDEPTAGQRYQLGCVEVAGGVSAVADSLDGVNEFLRRLGVPFLV